MTNLTPVPIAELEGAALVYAAIIVGCNSLKYDTVSMAKLIVSGGQEKLREVVDDFMGDGCDTVDVPECLIGRKEV